ncbi:transposase family protein [Mitsuaria sp. TWR114]|uniref:DDE-type integrase/transposase/recombinase n=1 Tax=Mitsuaria sp. TWR114 TaxID=2601731 RepID=UPI0011BFE088|nr:DDE-type integrase/transposase/recombinase [Mitsuaria sp. TWR114]TXD94216.1 transposase family protein [Mitsuaria sp. TWR114]
MLTDIELERKFSEFNISRAGRALVRQIRDQGPVRNLQNRNDCVRTRIASRKMDRALYAESRTVEYPAIYLRERDRVTEEIWPQPCEFDLTLEGSRGGSTRVQHMPDLFLIDDTGFVIEEWREEERLLRLAAKHPDRFYKDDAGRWHFTPVEKHCEAMGIQYRLRSADELPRVFLSNLRFLEDYSLETTPPLEDSVRRRIKTLLQERSRIPHLELVVAEGVCADDVFKAIEEGSAYVDLDKTLLRKTDELVIYQDKTVAQADALLNQQHMAALPGSALVVSVGTKFLYEKEPYEVVLMGTEEVIARDSTGKTTHLPLTLVQGLFERDKLVAAGPQVLQQEFDRDELFHAKRLQAAIERLAAMNNPAESGVSERTLRFWRQKVAGLTSPQDQLRALMFDNPGNTKAKLPLDTLEFATEAAKSHNTVACPSIFATYNRYVALCDEAGKKPMSHTSFYRWIRGVEDIALREGRRKAYQKAPIPLTWDYEHPVHGVLPHEVAYCDHTVMNVFLKGRNLPDLGKPTLTLMSDGALSKARALFVSYGAPSTVSVLMCLRDYVRRNHRLPRVLVLDNGKEFHSTAIKQFCSTFGIEIRWRRRSQPRDSSPIERMIGLTEQEFIAQLSGNSIALKDPREVSSSHQPQKHIEWTLPAIHGGLQHLLFEIQPNRIHPRFGMTPNDYERRLILEAGAREHLMVRYDSLMRLLTAPHSGSATRVVDRGKGVKVDGLYYWNDMFALAKVGEQCEVRVEIWHASVVYACFRGKWVVAQARDGGRLEGRYRPEAEYQRREETRRSKSEADKDRRSAKHSRERAKLWVPENWDDRLREQLAEEYYLARQLGMAEVSDDARNPKGFDAHLGLFQGNDVGLLSSVIGEADERPDDELDGHFEAGLLQPSSVIAPASTAVAPSDDLFF